MVAGTAPFAPQDVRGLPLAIRVSRQTDGRLLHHLVCVAEASRILNWIVRSRTRHLHAHFGTNSAEIAMQIHVLGGPPFSFTVHGPDDSSRHWASKTRSAEPLLWWR